MRTIKFVAATLKDVTVLHIRKYGINCPNIAPIIYEKAHLSDNEVDV